MRDVGAHQPLPVVVAHVPFRVPVLERGALLHPDNFLRNPRRIFDSDDREHRRAGIQGNFLSLPGRGPNDRLPTPARQLEVTGAAP